MIWNKPKTENECYFCQTDCFGFSNKSKKKVFYPNFCSAKKPQAHNAFRPIPAHPDHHIMDHGDQANDADEAGDKDYSFPDAPVKFSQCELNDRANIFEINCHNSIYCPSF